MEFEKFYKKELTKKDNGPDAEFEELRKKISEADETTEYARGCKEIGSKYSSVGH
ncbi:hypothetical protein EBI_27278 [Enterocytozoon bieneusi H348]|nr:hypothetical protein EBI_27278 [Enterocytozoon bieneusi H348]|eukprot:XP_002650933.1 hypothetical protein EBI_27278 [Enterocytozoon bieneusi H348]